MRVRHQALSLLSWASSGICGLLTPYSASNTCSSEAFPYPEVEGAKILTLTAQQVHNYTSSLAALADWPGGNFTQNFCNVTITYTHPRWNDTINVWTWLPLENWNGRYMAQGGGGFVTGDANMFHPPALDRGFAVTSTDGGHVGTNDPSTWALTPDGKIDYYRLKDFAYIALHDANVMGKALAEAFYGQPPNYSYYSSCSSGGRQGLTMAQRYPHDYDGILALSPAINWATFIIAEYWPQLVMNQLGVYPRPCELDAISAAAIEACDELDGVKDGIVAAPSLCKFDPHTLVGQTFNCSGVEASFTEAAATIALETWRGPAEWFGVNPGTPLTGYVSLANTQCASPTSTDCEGVSFIVATGWISLFLEQNPNFDLKSLNYETYGALFELSRARFEHIISNNNPDLSNFAAAGGKMVTWHGLEDEVIPPNGSSHYYQRVLDEDANARDYYRFFELPGTFHCRPGLGPFPNDTLSKVMRWVEEGVAPDTLDGVIQDPITGEVKGKRKLCQWPLVEKYVGGDITQEASFVCSESF